MACGMLCAFRGHGVGGFIGVCVVEARSMQQARVDTLTKLCTCLPHPRILQLAYVALPPAQALARVSDYLDRRGNVRLSGQDDVCFHDASNPTVESQLQDAVNLISVPEMLAHRVTEEESTSIDTDVSDLEEGVGIDTSASMNSASVADSATSLLDGDSDGGSDGVYGYSVRETVLA